MRFVRALVWAATATVLSASMAASHGQKTMSEPADGAVLAMVERAVLHFDQPVRLTDIALTDGNGIEVALPQSRSLAPEAEKVIPLPDLEPGAYRIEWRALSQDGHPIEGGFGFTLQP